MKSASTNRSGALQGSDGGREEACERALHRLQIKQDIVAQLVAGRVSLLEAAARFRAASQPFSDGASLGSAIRPVQESAEHICRTLIGWAYLALSEYPERAEAVTNRLETDLQEVLDRQGSISLPG
jgi:hypothetical protein